MWLASLFLLLLNDHALKGAAAPAWLTGKLSDFVGLVVAAVLLAALCRVRTGRGWVLSHVAVGLGFAAINVSPAAARWVEQVTAATPFPWRIVVDPTDLVGLWALPLSAVVLGRACREGRAAATAWRRFGQRLAIAAGGFACMATAPPCDEQCTEPWIPSEFGALAVGNNTGVERLVRVRPLAASVVVDCEEVLAEPSYALPRELFGAAETWLVDASRAVPLVASDGDCSAYLIETEGLSPTLLVWDNAEFPNRRVPTDATEDHPAVAVMREESGRLLLRHDAAVRLRTPPPPRAACAIPEPGESVAWSDPRGGGVVESIETSPDGCNDIGFENGRNLVICLPGPLPFEVGDVLDMDSAVVGDGARESEVLTVFSDEATVELGRGSVLPPGASRIDGNETCGLQRDACGNSVRPARLTIEAGEPASGGAGTVFSLAGGGELTVVRAQQMPARDLDCAPAALSLDYVEYALVRPAAN